MAQLGTGRYLECHMHTYTCTCICSVFIRFISICIWLNAIAYMCYLLSVVSGSLKSRLSLSRTPRSARDSPACLVAWAQDKHTCNMPLRVPADAHVASQALARLLHSYGTQSTVVNTAGDDQVGIRRRVRHRCVGGCQMRASHLVLLVWLLAAVALAEGVYIVKPPPSKRACA